jgi:hypothetical protein
VFLAVVASAPPWHYWIAPVLTAVALVAVVAVALGYVVRVASLAHRARQARGPEAPPAVETDQRRPVESPRERRPLAA